MRVSNHDVKFRIAEATMLTILDHSIRHHLATDDSGHNEVERMQSYVGDATCDGGPIDWENQVTTNNNMKGSLKIN